MSPKAPRGAPVAPSSDEIPRFPPENHPTKDEKRLKSAETGPNFLSLGRWSNPATIFSPTATLVALDLNMLLRNTRNTGGRCAFPLSRSRSWVFATAQHPPETLCRSYRTGCAGKKSSKYDFKCRSNCCCAFARTFTVLQGPGGMKSEQRACRRPFTLKFMLRSASTRRCCFDALNTQEVEGILQTTHYYAVVPVVLETKS